MPKNKTAEKKKLRKISPPFLVKQVSGTRTRTRLKLTKTEELALTEIGDFLGSLYRKTLSSRINLGNVTAEEVKSWRATEKQLLTSQTSSRWAGAITRTVLDEYNLGIRNLKSNIENLEAAISTISTRMEIKVGEFVVGNNGKKTWGYATEFERYQKSRRKTALKDSLAIAQARLEQGHPRIVAGSSRLLRNRNNLGKARINKQQWRQKWDNKRAFFTADGESGQVGGNLTIRVDESGLVTIKVPGGLQHKYGKQITLTNAVSFSTNNGAEWQNRIETRKSIRYDIIRKDGKWYIDPSWAYKDVPQVSLEVLSELNTLAIDLNDGHVDVAVIDKHGNVIGIPERFDFIASGSTKYRDAQLRHLITKLLHYAKSHNCHSITIENLNFSDARSIGREAMGRGKRGKRFRRTVAGIPTAQFRDRLVAMSSSFGIGIIAVDPAYTSQWGKEHWLKPMRLIESSIDGHRCAAVVIGRRGKGHRARRKPVKPANQQSMNSGQLARSVGTVSPAPHNNHATRKPKTINVAGRKDKRKRDYSPKTVRGECNPSLSLESTQ